MTKRARPAPFLAALALLLVAAFAASLAVGSAENPTREIVLGIRLPRALLAAIVGGALASAGALLQALLQNPLADPYVLGISGGAALGGVLALGLGAGSWLGLAAVPLVAFAGALAASVLLWVVAGAGERAPAHSLLLTGVVLNAFASSLIVLIASATDFTRAAGVFVWLIGSVRLVETPLLVGVALLFALGLGLALRESYALNLLAQGDELATHLGVDVARTRRRVLAATALMIGASVAVSGLIGFVGLIVPHACRLIAGADNRLLVPASALAGASFLVIADSLARVLFAPTELPVGALTALVGGPLFLVLLRRELRGLGR